MPSDHRDDMDEIRAKLMKPRKNPDIENHRACSMFPNCDEHPEGCLLAFMEKDPTSVAEQHRRDDEARKKGYKP